MRQAYESLARGLQTAAHGVVVVPMEEFQRFGPTQAVKSVLQALPGAVIRPMIGATEAISRALLGVQNTMDPRKQKELEDRFKATS
jgi:autophagy-related protein 2